MSGATDRYRFVPAGTLPGLTVDSWAVACNPAAMIRFKRVFARVTPWRTGGVVVAHTPQVARDLEWFIERYPLAPVDEESHRRLTEAADKHRRHEATVQEILSHERPSMLPQQPPAVPARPYQQQAVDLLRASGGLLLVDEVGLGKTFQGLLAASYDDARPAVIVPPTHLPPRWLDEVKRHFPHLRVHVAKKGSPTYPIADRVTGASPDVIVVPYSKIAGWADWLVETYGARTVIFDEVQDLRRGQGTDKGRAAARLADACKYRLGLTATPVYNYGGELWNLMNVLAPDTLGTHDEFLREWGGRTWNGNTIVKDPAALGAHLRREGVMLGRTRKEVGRELPETIVVRQDVDADPDVIANAEGDAAEMARLILSQSSTTQERFRASGEIDMLMRQATGVAKAPYVAGFVRMLLESEDKIVLFGWHRAVYDIWLETLAELRPVMYTGSESATQKEAALRRFCQPNSEGGSRVLLMSLRSGAGVDVLKDVSRVVVFGELDWSPQVHQQAIGRLRRDGMGDAPVVAYYLTSTQGSDPAIAEVLQVKRVQNDATISPDGRLMNVGTVDASRARALAEQVLAGLRGRGVAA